MSRPSLSINFLILSWRFVIGMAIAGALLVLLFSLASPLQYSSTVRVFITQLNATGLDPYTAIKSTERIASSLSELVYTTTFYTNTLNQAQGFDAAYFSPDDFLRRRAWRRTIATSVTAGTGIMTVTAYHPNPEQARIIVDAAARELALEAPNYFGSNVRVQVIDAPLNSRWFVKPDFVFNGLFGLLIGFLLGVIWVLLRGHDGEL